VLPNGDARRYVSNHQSQCSDLKAVDPKEACLVAKHWMNNIVAQEEILPEDQNILKRIERLCDFAEQNEDERYVYLIWIPKGVMRDVLFIVIVFVDSALSVRLLVPSPFWDSPQIGSCDLQLSLQHLAKETNRELDLDKLFKNDHWFKLEWNIRTK
jgi:hypothetical protein